ncbi:hypothetical protein J8I87_18360 [Paraburkholderia sp. LEh10]|uniref:hypothetical protein n=1 Tax=Paraburkholderia sp. LEh10 TaxID=2821353 RepID=UPI001AE1BF25|nr:hypothetical protein [Paraburkholderia sp. LEh10]MBP0591655.1 hypothetical protein [Paraburkholderia sp. LEh10]
MTADDKATSDRIAHLAAVVMRQPAASKTEKELAGSALAQHHTSKHTSVAIGKVAGHVLTDRQASAEAKELAGSVLAQVRKFNGASPQR